jgi:hypothetical protein
LLGYNITPKKMEFYYTQTSHQQQHVRFAALALLS